MRIKAVYDSGSNVSLINQRIIDVLKSSLIKHSNAFKTINGLNFSSARADIILKIGNLTNTLNTYVVKQNEFSYDLLLGLDAIKKFKLNQDDNLNILQRCNKNKLVSLEEIEKENNDSLYFYKEEALPDISEVDKNIKIAQEDEENDKLGMNFKINYTNLLNNKELETYITHIEDKQKRMQILNLISDNRNVFALDKFDIGREKVNKAEINLVRNEYITTRIYKCSLPDEAEIKTQLKKLLAADMIEESDSPFASPVTLAYKKEDGRRSRLCIDFRQLNKLIISECYYFPTINDIIDKIPNCKFFTVLDINSAFWSIPLKEEDKKKQHLLPNLGNSNGKFSRLA